MSLSSCKKPGGGPLLHYSYTLFNTPDQTRRVVYEININSDLFVLNFSTHFIYTYISALPQL